MVSVGSECGCHLAGCLWLKVSYEVASNCWAEADVHLGGEHLQVNLRVCRPWSLATGTFPLSCFMTWQLVSPRTSDPRGSAEDGNDSFFTA